MKTRTLQLVRDIKGNLNAIFWKDVPENAHIYRNITQTSWDRAVKTGNNMEKSSEPYYGKVIQFIFREQ